MRKLSEMIGLRLVTIEDGHEVGIIRSVIINPEKGSLDYLATEKGVHLLKAQVVQSKYIEGMGNYAVTVKSKDKVQDIHKVPEAMAMVEKGVEVIGNIVLTRKGMLIGEAVDLKIDDSNQFLIERVEIISNESEPRILTIPRKKVLTYGANFVIIEDDDKYFEGQGNDKTPLNVEFPLVDPEHSKIGDASENNSFVAQAQADGIKNITDFFERKQMQFIIGKYCNASIFTSTGEQLIKQGEIVDELAYHRVKVSGKLIELIKNINK